jgi:hypothetical protein
MAEQSIGWIKLHRELMDKAIWKCSTSEQKIILITLLLMANHEANQWVWQGKKYTVQPGQVITSLKSIADKAGPGISIKNVRTAIEKFEKHEFLTNKSTNKNRLITIVNWGFYQAKPEELANNPASNRQATGKQPATNKNDKNDKDIYIDHFNTFYKAYPKKVGKAAALKSFSKLPVSESMLNGMLSAIEKQKGTKQWQDNQFIPNPATWLNQRRWEDEVETQGYGEEKVTMTADGVFKF